MKILPERTIAWHRLRVYAGKMLANPQTMQRTAACCCLCCPCVFSGAGRLGI
jgi:hypothetical protein